MGKNKKNLRDLFCPVCGNYIGYADDEKKVHYFITDLVKNGWKKKCDCFSEFFEMARKRCKLREKK